MSLLLSCHTKMPHCSTSSTPVSSSMSSGHNHHHQMMIKMISLLLAMAIGVHCHPLVAIPASTTSSAAATIAHSQNSNDKQQPEAAHITGSSQIKSLGDTKHLSMLVKRSIQDESASYAGHSIMRFGRAPHNIMHFGKRGTDDMDKLQAAAAESVADSPLFNDQTSRSDSATAPGPMRYVLVPVSYYYDPVSAIHKKSIDNLEPSRGVFMHFG